MQLLYQIDQRGEADTATILAELTGDEEAFDSPPVIDEAGALAKTAWAMRQEADATVRELAPDWPTYRQPVVDRAILRLAYHEMRSGRTPVKVAINEAVELAKEYGGEHSSAFVNGVLDKIARRLQPPSLNEAKSP